MVLIVVGIAGDCRGLPGAPGIAGCAGDCRLLPGTPGIAGDCRVRRGLPGVPGIAGCTVDCWVCCRLLGTETIIIYVKCITRR